MNTKVLMSIKPEFALKIFDWSKKFEFRKTIFKNKDIKKIIVYASSPIQKVIWEFEVEYILKKDLDELWLETEEYAWISKEYFLDYFKNKSVWYAIKIKNPKKYKNFLGLKNDFNIDFAPQSFIYLEKIILP